MPPASARIAWAVATLGLLPGHRCSRSAAATAALHRIRDAPTPDGRPHPVVHPPVTGGADAFAGRAGRVLPDHGLRVDDVLRHGLGTSDAVCVVATRA